MSILEWTLEMLCGVCGLCTLLVVIPFDVFATLTAIELHRLVKELRTINR